MMNHVLISTEMRQRRQAMQLFKWILLEIFEHGHTEMSAVSLTSSFGIMEECFPLFHSLHHTHEALLIWAKNEVKLTSLPFLPSAYKKMNATAFGWSTFCHLLLWGWSLFGTHSLLLGARCACLLLAEVEKFVWKLLTGSTDAQDTWRQWLDCCWCYSQSVMVSCLTYDTNNTRILHLIWC